LINAHVSQGDDPNYPYKLCIKTSEGGGPTDECNLPEQDKWYDSDGAGHYTDEEEGYCDNEDPDSSSRIDISASSNWNFQWEDACCSGSLACVGDDADGGDSLCRFVSGLSTITKCEDYGSEVACRADARGVADSNAPLNTECSDTGENYELLSAKCVWENNECNSEWNFGDYYCSVSQDPQQCRGTDMLVLVSSILNWNTEPNSCTAGELCPTENYITVCGGETLKLFGFTWVNAILVLLILAAFYIAFLKRKKKKNEKVLKIGKRDSGKKRKK